MDYCSAIVVAHRVAQWRRWVWWLCLSWLLCVWVCVRYAFDSSTKWVEIFVVNYSRSPQPLLPSSSGLLHIRVLLMQYFAFRFCVLSILLHARNILRSLRSCHCSIIIVCPDCAMPGPSSDTFAARFGHRVDRITTTRWPCSRCSSSCRCWC